MILVIYLLTPFTMTHSIHLFQGFRIIQTRMMVLAVIHGLRPNQKLKSILEGCADLTHLWGSTLHTHNLFSRPFFQSQSAYIRFTHIANMQPKFYIGSAMHHTLDREYSSSRKYLQLTNERLVQAELALPYWREHDNLTQFVHLGTHPNIHRTCRLSQLGTGHHSRTATPAQLSLHMSILPPSERHSQEACPQHQCPIWFGNAMASSKTQVHSSTGTSNLDIHTVSKPSGTMDHYPRSWIKYKSQI